MIYISDKQTQKPLWTDRKYQYFCKLAESDPDSISKSLHKMIQPEKCALLADLRQNIPFSVRSELKKQSNQNKMKILSQNKDSLYNTDSSFKTKVDKTLNFYGLKENKEPSRVNFKCRPFDKSELPPLAQDSMNCQGSAKIKDVIGYLVNEEDELYKYIRGIPPPKR